MSRLKRRHSWLTRVQSNLRAEGALFELFGQRFHAGHGVVALRARRRCRRDQRCARHGRRAFVFTTVCQTKMRIVTNDAST